MATGRAARPVIAALYIDPRGPYPGLLGADHCWDEKRDARTYSGTGPVIVHPPCGPWGWLRRQYKGNGAALALCAVEQVQRLGGVLEHPNASKLWEHAGLPYPDDGFGPDEFGGVTLEVRQVDWGHCARKRTWLYIVNKSENDRLDFDIEREIKRRHGLGKPTHYIGGSRTNPNGAIPPGMKAINAEKRRKTPVEFAKFLISIAERCGAETVSNAPLTATGSQCKVPEP